MFREQKKYFVVFGKEPIKGFSKTRLAEDLGEKASLRLYDAFIKDFFMNLKRAQEEDFILKSYWVIGVICDSFKKSILQLF